MLVVVAGFPIAYDGPVYHGVDAVIDKDFAAAKKWLNSLKQMFFCGINCSGTCFFVNFGQANQQALTDVTVTAMQQYIEENQFAPGSMLPKVEAAISFAESKPNRQSDYRAFRISFGSNQRRKVVHELHNKFSVFNFHKRLKQTHLADYLNR